MRTSLIAVVAAFSLVIQAASAHPTVEAWSGQTGYQSTWIDNARGDYVTEASPSVDHTRAAQRGDHFTDASWVRRTFDKATQSGGN